MVSKNQSKFIKSLKIKKYRVKESMFLVEGKKNVLELLKSDFEIQLLLGTEVFLFNHLGEFKGLEKHQIVQASDKELSDLGTFKTNQDCLAVVKMKPEKYQDIDFSNHVFVLDGVSDPGNLGTIIRTLDWFGFDQVLCSANSADFYNPKTINATMGSFTRVSVSYGDVPEFLKSKPVDVMSYGAAMEGENPADINLGQPSIIVFGSESHGISNEVGGLLDKKISIPGKGMAESLNVGIAAGIISYLASKGL
ncbi:MAG: RNA methyltransferase [Cyclobacteriaceae bacterium]